MLPLHNTALLPFIKQQQLLYPNFGGCQEKKKIFSLFFYRLFTRIAPEVVEKESFASPEEYSAVPDFPVLPVVGNSEEKLPETLE